MAKTTIYISLAVGGQVPAAPAYVAFRSPYRFVADDGAMVLPEPSPVALAADGTGAVAVDPGVWLVEEILPTNVYRRAVVVPVSATPVQYSNLEEVTSPVEIGFGPSWAAAALQAAAAASASADRAENAADALPDFLPDPYVDDTPVIFHYGTNIDAARPATDRVVMWIGTGGPTNASPNDVILSTTVISSGGGGGTPGPGDGFVGPLDSYPTPFRAHSLRRLTSMYTGAAIRVRRSSDGTESDIGFSTNGDLNTAALAAFAGSGSAYIVRWYDQSGNGRHLTQTVVANQPRIVNAGAIDVNGSKPRIVFDGVDDFLASPVVGLYAAGAATVAAVLSAASSANASAFGEFGTSSANSYRMARIGAGSVSPLMRVSATAASATLYSVAAIAGDTTFDGNPHHLFLVDTGSALSYWRDTVQTMTAIAAARGAALELVNFGVGASAYTVGTVNGFINGGMQELLMWGSDQLALRGALSPNQRTYWGIA